MSKRLKRLLGILAVLVVVFAITNSDRYRMRRPGPIVRATQAAVETKEEGLELLDENGLSLRPGFAITGRIRNNTAKAYSYVQVAYTLYNNRGEVVDTALAKTTKLMPGEVWKFKAVGMTGEGEHFKIYNISGF